MLWWSKYIISGRPKYLISRGKRVTIEERLVATNYRGPGFDQIRLFAAIVVLLYHSRSVEYADLQADPLFNYSGGFVQFGLLAVLVFFAISGFLVTPGLARSGNVIEYMVHRALRIFPALFVVVVGSMLILGPLLTVLSLASYFSDPNFYLYGKNILTLSVRYLPGVLAKDGQPIIVNGALWTLHFEVLSYLALALVSMLVGLGRRGVWLAVYLASYAAYVAISLIPAVVALLPDRFVTFVGLFVYFAGGATVYLFRDWIPFSKMLALGALAAVIVALPAGVGGVFMPVCLPYLIIFVGLSTLPGSSLFKRDLSYGVYLIHAPILVVLMSLFPGVQTWWVGAGIVLIITLFLAYLSWTFVEAPTLKQKRHLSKLINDKIAALRPRWSMRDPVHIEVVRQSRDGR